MNESDSPFAYTKSGKRMVPRAASTSAAVDCTPPPKLNANGENDGLRTRLLVRPDLLVFSKDRAAQLDLLLRSIDRFAPDLYASIVVLFATSAPEYDQGYSRLVHHFDGRHPTRYLVDEEAGFFEYWVRRWLHNAGEHVSFLCDDDVFYAEAPELTETDLPYSLRGGDYDYPFSLDGNVYAKEQIVHLLHGWSFANPTQLEAKGDEHLSRLPFSLVRHGTPCLVGVPLNRVSADSRMPHFGVHQWELNEQWLNGLKFEPSLEGPYGAHMSHDELAVIVG